MPLYFSKIFHESIEFLRAQKFIAFGPVDALLTVLSIFFAFLLRFEGALPIEYYPAFGASALVMIVLNLVFLHWQNLYAFTWEFVGLSEIARLVKALTFSSAAFSVIIFLDRDTTNVFLGFPRSVIVINYFLSIVLIGTLRMAKRVWVDLMARQQGGAKGRKRTLVVGAGAEGAEIVRSLLKRSRHEFEVLGIVDHRPAKHNTLLHGIKVIGHVDDIPTLKEALGLEGIIIALDDSHVHVIKRAVHLAREAGIKTIKIIPQFSDLLQQKVSFEMLKDVSIEDLLGRDPVTIDTKTIGAFVSGKKVLVTGAAGSIGSEICRQLVRFQPREILMLDFNESGLFDMEEEFKMKFPGQSIQTIIANITNREKMNALFGELRPDVVFHAAAYKHVPLMEYWPDEAVATNVFGTSIVAQAARSFGVEKFVLVSTDKAVRPNSIMGKSKRASELVVQALNELGPTKFVTVRFGNVLASRGSVVPLFEKQIKQRAQLTVTHPEMQRYFMTIPEASLLVLEAGAVGQGGEICILDMGEPKKIVELAHEMIRLSGLEPDKDVPIVFTGVRPGEKLFEELLTEEEKRVGATHWQKIFMSRSINPPRFEEVEEKLAALEQALRASPEELRAALDEFIRH